MNNDNLAVQVTDTTGEAFLKEPVGGLIMKNGLPAVASMLFMAFYQMTDAVIVGRKLGPEALASVNVLYPVLALFVGVAVLLGVGGNSRIAVLLGAGNAVKARHLLGFVVALGAAVGIGGSLFVVAAFPHILATLGTTGSLGELAGNYLRVLYPFFTPMVLVFILEQAMRNDGRANFSAAVMATTAVLNIILDYLFLFHLEMGIGGAALATGIAQTLGAVLFLACLLKKNVKKLGGLGLDIPRGSLADLRAIAWNGSSEMLSSLALGLTTFLFNRVILAQVGAEGVTAFALVQYMLIIGVVFFTGMSNGSQPVFGYNHGAGLGSRVQSAFRCLLVTNLLAGVLFFAVLRRYSPLLIAVFIPEHPEAQLLTLRVAGFMSWSLLFMPVGIAASVYFTALENAMYSLGVAVCRSLLLVVTGLALLPYLFGEAGIWLTPVFAEMGAACVAGILLGRKKAAKREKLATPAQLTLG